MTKQKRTRNRILGLVSLALIIATATYGFAEVSTVHSAGFFGAGYGVKSPYKVSKISYTLDVENPNNLTAVEFEIDQEGVLVTAGVSAKEKAQISWADQCEQTSSSWTCTFEEGVDVLAADWLHVSPVQ